MFCTGLPICTGMPYMKELVMLGSTCTSEIGRAKGLEEQEVASVVAQRESPMQRSAMFAIENALRPAKTRGRGIVRAERRVVCSLRGHGGR